MKALYSWSKLLKAPIPYSFTLGIRISTYGSQKHWDQSVSILGYLILPHLQDFALYNNKHLFQGLEYEYFLGDCFSAIISSDEENS